MPTYDYRCEPCHLTFEIKRSMKDSSEVVCPKCKRPAKQVFGRANIMVKGGEFSSGEKREWWQRPGMDECFADAASAAKEVIKEHPEVLRPPESQP
ncbi:MAG: zinc ribbon domain-containing protein [Chloroflexota bacterium]